jgi:hypothetical protein
MKFYFEGIIFYFFLLDCIIYNVMSWSTGKFHDKVSHWLSDWFPLNRFFGLFYFILILWVGFALYRMTLLGFSF